MISSAFGHKYDRTELLAFRQAAAVSLLRSTRKSIFRYGLWQPMRYRRQPRTAETRDPGTKRGPAGKLKVALINARSIVNKAPILHRIICERDLDLVAVLETWMPQDCPDAISNDLGVNFSTALNFTDHISKAKQRLFLLKKRFLSKNPKILILAFKIYIIPLLEYYNVFNSSI